MTGMWGVVDESAVSARRISFGLDREAAERFAAEMPGWVAMPFEDERWAPLPGPRVSQG